jgi:hypothetical protein
VERVADGAAAPHSPASFDPGKVSSTLPGGESRPGGDRSGAAGSFPTVLNRGRRVRRAVQCAGVHACGGGLQARVGRCSVSVPAALSCLVAWSRALREPGKRCGNCVETAVFS